MLDQNQNTQPQNNTGGMPPISDVPPMPEFPNVTTTTSTTTTTQTTDPIVQNPQQASDYFPPMITNPPKKKFGSGKIIATFLGVLLLIGGITAGIVLTRQPQKLNELASSNDSCNVSFDLPDTAVCWMDPIANVPITYTVNSLPETGGPFFMETDWFVAAPNAGPNHYDVSQQIVEGGKYTVYASWPGVTDRSKTTEIHAGLQVRDSNGNMLNPNCTGGMDYYWTQYVTCNSTPTPTASSTPAPTPTTKPSGSPNSSPTPSASPTTPGSPTATCSAVKAYNSEWTELSATQLSNLEAGDIVNYCVNGTTTSGSFDMAKFTINNVVQPETAIKRPSSSDYCQEYEIPQDENTFTIKAQIHHVTMGWIGQ